MDSAKRLLVALRIDPLGDRGDGVGDEETRRAGVDRGHVDLSVSVAVAVVSEASPPTSFPLTQNRKVPRVSQTVRNGLGGGVPTPLIRFSCLEP